MTIGNDPFLTAQRTGLSGSQYGSSQRKQKLAGRKSLSSLRGSSRAASLAYLILFPWLVFSCVMCLLTFPYHKFQILVWVLVGFCAALSIIFFTLKQRGGNWYLFCGALCALAVALGVVLGLYNYHEYMYAYWTYDENREYTNVIPSEPAAAHSDAGKLYFTTDSHVDTFKAVGFKHEGSTYCVAPIMDDTQTSRVEYWAVGFMDPPCCDRRSTFTCDDAANPKAQAGLVVLDDEGFLSKNFREYYMGGVKEAEAAFELVSASKPVFVRWVVDPDEVQNDYWKSGVGFLCAVSFVYLLFSVFLGALASMHAGGKVGAEGGYRGDEQTPMMERQPRG